MTDYPSFRHGGLIPGSQKTIHRLFKIGLIAKAVDGALEIACAAILFALNPDQIGTVVRALTQGELSEDPDDLVAGFLLRSFQHLSTGTELFAAFFLLWHGMVKLGLVATLLLEQWWGFPTAIGAFGLFLAYQLYRYSHTHSPWLLALSIVDLFVIVITWLEYMRLRTLHALR